MPAFTASREVIAETLNRWSLRSCPSPEGFKWARNEVATGILISYPSWCKHLDVSVIREFPPENRLSQRYSRPYRCQAQLGEPRCKRLQSNRLGNTLGDWDMFCQRRNGTTCGMGCPRIHCAVLWSCSACITHPDSRLSRCISKRRCVSLENRKPIGLIRSGLPFTCRSRSIEFRDTRPPFGYT